MIVPAYIAKKVINKASGNTPKAQTNNGSDITKKATVIGLGVLGLGVSYFVGRKIIRNIRKTRTERKFTTESQQALLLRSALNPSGASWLIWMDGTKEEAIYNVAAQITNFRKVQQDYQNLYNSSLITDLQKELDTDDYTKFMNIINSGGIQNQTIENLPATGNNTLQQFSSDEIKGKVILIKDKTRIYEKLIWYPLGSVKKVDSGYFINHLATGNFKKVNLGYGQFVEFVETRIKTTEGSVKAIYINKSNVSMVSKDDFTNNYRNNYTKLIFRDSDF